MQVSALMDLAANGERATQRKEAPKADRAGAHGTGKGSAAGTASACRPAACRREPRYVALAVASALVPGSPIASGAAEASR